VTGVESAELGPEAVFDAIKDAVALIRACAAKDDEGVLAIVRSTENLPYLTAMTATAAVIICRRAGLHDNAAASALLGTVLEELADRLVSRERSPEGGD
jgi:hypothetical protein